MPLADRPNRRGVAMTTQPPAHSHPDDPNPVHVIVWYDYI